MNHDGSPVLTSSTRSAVSKAQSLRGTDLVVRTSSVESFLRGRQRAIRPSASTKGEDARIVFVEHSLTGRGSDWSLHGPAKNLVKVPGASSTTERPIV